MTLSKATSPRPTHPPKVILPAWAESVADAPTEFVFTGVSDALHGKRLMLMVCSDCTALQHQVTGLRNK